MFTGATSGKTARSISSTSTKPHGRCGAAAVALAAAAALGAAGQARADVAGFSTFGPVNQNADPGAGVNGNILTLTTGANNESATDFTAAEQNISSSWVATFTLVASGGADGGALILQSSGATALGGGGGGVGYTGIGSSLGAQYEFYNTSQLGVGLNGAVPALSGAGGVAFNSGNPINFTITYTSNPTSGIGSLGIQAVDTVTKASGFGGIANINLQQALGGSMAYIGFGGGTGGANSTQNISSFNFHNIGTLAYAPIAISGGFNEDVVVEKGAPQAGAAPSVTATMDGGTTLTGYTWYEQGYNAAAPTTGLPPSGSRFTSQADPQHQFQMQNYNGNNVLLVGSNSPASGTLTLTNPQAFTALSFLTGTGNGADNFDITINYADTHPATVISEVVTPDWFGNGPAALVANGRVMVGTGTTASGFQAVNSGNPKLFQDDVQLPDTTDPIASITITADGGGGREAVFAVSGAATVSGTLVYTGIDPFNASNKDKFDTTSETFSSGGAPAVFTTGAAVVFDDTADNGTGPHAVTIGPAGVLPSNVTFNNNASNYTLAAGGGPIIGTTGINLNGTGTVTILNANTFTGNANVNAGQLVIGNGGSIASGTVVIASGAMFTMLAGAQPAGTTVLGVADNGVANFNGTSQSVAALTGNGVVNLNGGVALTAGLGTNFNGSFGGTGGSLAFNNGSVTVNSPGALAGITGGITVGGVITSAASLIINDNSGTAGAGITTTLGTNGSLTTPAGVNGTYAGNIVLAGGSAVAPPTISGGGQTALGAGNAVLTVTGNISGVGPVAIASMNNSTVVLTGTNTYTGETVIAANDTATYNKVTLMAGAANTLSPNSGININGGASAGSILELNGFNQSVAYLTGGFNPAAAITNNGGPNATLTINNGNTATGAATFYGQITQGGNGTLAVLKAGLGNQILGGNNSYQGGTTVSGGTLTVSNSAALGYGPVTLSGGTLNLATPTGTSIVSGVSGLKLNQAGTGDAASVSGSTLTLTDGTASQGNSAFTTNPVAVGGTAGFYASFVYNSSAGTGPGNTADGITFTIQNDPRGNAAVGGSGGALGYGPNNNGSSITQSGSVQFNIYGNPTVGTTFATNGTIPTDTPTGSGLTLYDGNPKLITLVYNAQAQTLTESIYENPSAQFSIVYPNVNFGSILNGSSTAYVGFTGGTGAVTATQTVSNFSFGSLVYTPTSLTNTGNAVTVMQTSSPSVLNLPASGTSTFASVPSLTITPGATLKLTSVGGSGTNFHSVLSTSTLNLGSGSVATGTLDIGKNDLDLPNTDVGTVTGYVRSGFNYAHGGAWNGPGITSGGAAANTAHLTAVGAISNNGNGNGPLYGSGTTLGLFDGSNPGPFDVLVKYTYFGDANLDGKVDGSDYSLIDAGYGSKGSLTGWYNGDFNYDGVIDGSDYALIDNAFNNQSSPQTASLTAEVATATAQVSPAAVPEPASVAVAALAAAGLFARRRRR
jgi:fibronectin-binding autotransporter adhesin